jgi:hypothetical protein
VSVANTYAAKVRDTETMAVVHRSNLNVLSLLPCRQFASALVALLNAESDGQGGKELDKPVIRRQW